MKTGMESEKDAAGGGAEIPELAIERWEDLLEGKHRAALADILKDHLATRRWFGGKARRIRRVEITDAIPLPPGPSGFKPFIAMVHVKYSEGDEESYLVPLAAAGVEPSPGDTARGALARLRIGGRRVLLQDAFQDRSLCRSLLLAIAERQSSTGEAGDLVAWPTGVFASIRGSGEASLEPSLIEGEQSNTSVKYGDRFILKFFRRFECGMSLELEIGRFLTERASFPHTPPLAGAIEYRKGGEEPATLAILQGFVPNEGDAWRYTLKTIGRFFRRVLSRKAPAPAVLRKPFIELIQKGVSLGDSGPGDSYLESAELLGRRTAGLHRALAGGADVPGFAPEPFSAPRRKEIHEGMIRQADRSFRLLGERTAGLSGSAREAARAVLERKGEVRDRFLSILEDMRTSLLIRCHGDYHLGQVLWTGGDFLIIDFEGEPARPLAERRRLRPALQDVAGMLRSFHYASLSALIGEGTDFSGEERDLLEPWARLWYLAAGTAFLRGYLDEAAGAPFLPETEEETQALLDCLLLEKAVYELGYELNNRPDWVRIPLQGILELLESPR